MNDAEKRDKVIQGLKAHCETWDGGKLADCITDPDMCPYLRTDRYGCTAALALLKKQEPRVMTFEEIKDNIGVPVWVEYADDENWNGYGVPTSDLEVYIMIFGANAFCAHNVCSNNVKWRCWTFRPSEQQMRDTPWEEKAE